jgi:outer membrane lipoprotein carrier protein
MKKQKSKIWKITCIFWFFLLPAVAYPITVDQLFQHLQKKYASLKDLRASFSQSTVFQSLGASNRQEIKGEGVFYLKRPHMMRWDYTEPEKQHIISDGRKIWVYLEEDQQVMVGPSASVLDKRLLSSFFMDTKSIKSEFNITLKEEAEDITLSLTPKILQPNLKSLYIWLKKKNYQIIKVSTIDLYGNTTTIVFTKILFNPGLPVSLFCFSPPKGVEVIKMPH